MNTCKTCKWWNGEEDRQCESPKLCSTEDDGLYARTDRMEDNIPFTGPEFGCVHHEPKDQS